MAEKIEYLIPIAEIKYLLNQVPARVRNHKVKFFFDKSIFSIEPISAGYGIAGIQKGTCFTVDQALQFLKV